MAGLPRIRFAVSASWAGESRSGSSSCRYRPVTTANPRRRALPRSSSDMYSAHFFVIRRVAAAVSDLGQDVQDSLLGHALHLDLGVAQLHLDAFVFVSAQP